jgi:hypothetical protein
MFNADVLVLIIPHLVAFLDRISSHALTMHDGEDKVFSVEEALMAMFSGYFLASLGRAPTQHRQSTGHGTGAIPGFRAERLQSWAGRSPERGEGTRGDAKRGWGPSSRT